MPCIFCIAVFASTVGALTGATIDALQDRLASVAADGRIRRTADSGTVTSFELTTTAGRAEVPVAVTVYKPQRRVRVQLKTHELPRAEAELVLRRVAERLGLTVVAMSDPADEAIVHDALERSAPDPGTAEQRPGVGPRPAR
jgi:hypothetical protein